jgi:hypothetical protein
MFRLSVLSVAFLLSVLIAPVFSQAADDRPVPPADPRSLECRAYQRQQIDYAHIALEKSRECSARNQAANNEDIVLCLPSCGGDILSAFRSYRQLSDAAWCALTGVGKKMSDRLEKANAAEQNADAVAHNENQKRMETEKLLQGQYAVAESGTDHLRKSVQRGREWASRLGQDLAAARRDVETQTALVANANDEASKLKTEESSAARQPLKEAGGSNFMLLVALEELRKSLQQEHDKNEALALELSTARASMYAYEAQAHKPSDEVADLKHAAEVSADGLRKSLQQEREHAGRLEQDLAAVRHDVETQTSLAAKATDDASRAKQAADGSAAELRQSLQQEQERGGHLERDLAAARRDVETQTALAAKATDDAGQAKQAADSSAAELRKSLQQEQERAGRLEQDLAAARRDFETQTALASKASGDASQLKQAAAQGSAELKQSLQKEHERAEALAKELSIAHATIYAYEAQARKASDQAANSQQASDKDAATLRISLKQEQERAGRLEQDLAAARRNVETQTAQAAKANEDAARSKQAAEHGSAELLRSLQKERDRAEALAQNLSMVYTAIYTYEVQARMASDQVAVRKQAELSAAEPRKSLVQPWEREARLEQELAAARRDVETQAARATKADGEAVRLKQAAADSSAESQRSLQQERDKTAQLERELASERKTKDVPAAPVVVTAGRVMQDKPPAPDAIKPVAATQTSAAAARSNGTKPDPENAAQVERLVARASVLLGQGDIGSARIVLERAAETGDAQASFALAETYDPLVLRRWGALGTLGDVAKARDLYAKAQAGGITEARERFDALRR